MNPRLVFVLMAGSIAACASSPSVRDVLPTHVTIAQNGSQLTPIGTQGEMYTYALSNTPFSILVPNKDANGNRYPVQYTHIEICASTDPAIFQSVKVGMNVQDSRCLNSGDGLFASSEQAAQGLNMFVSNRRVNIVEGLNVEGPLYNTVNVHQLINYNGTVRCEVLKHPKCPPMTHVVAGTKIYVVVFVDMNANNKIDLGEYTFIELDLKSS